MGNWRRTHHSTDCNIEYTEQFSKCIHQPMQMHASWRASITNWRWTHHSTDCNIEYFEQASKGIHHKLKIHASCSWLHDGISWAKRERVSIANCRCTRNPTDCNNKPTEHTGKGMTEDTWLTIRLSKLIEFGAHPPQIEDARIIQLIAILSKLSKRVRTFIKNRRCMHHSIDYTTE